MKIAYFPNQMALKSEAVWQAFLEGCKKCGLEPVEGSMTADTAVIWSVLWNGRLLANKAVYDHYRRQGKSVFIIEVGALKRGVTWKISLNHVNAEGQYPKVKKFDDERHNKLNLELAPGQQQRKPEILITLQHDRSLQWQGMPSTSDWLRQQIDQIRKYSDRPVVIRPHPRCPMGKFIYAGARIDVPNRIPNTYDQYNLNFGYHCIINHCSGPGIQAAIAGTPIIVSEKSLAYPVSSKMSDLESLALPDRTEWFQKILHTEWLVEEIAQGVPQTLLLEELTNI